MKNFGKILLASTAAIALCGAAQAADLPAYTKAPPLAPAPLVSCTSAVQFIVTDCPLTYYGITVYGTVDMGVGYESHGAPFNKNIISGVEELVQKNSNRGRCGFRRLAGSRSRTSASRAVETITPGLNFVFDLNFGFDSYSFTAANGPRSILRQQRHAARLAKLERQLQPRGSVL